MNNLQTHLLVKIMPVNKEGPRHAIVHDATPRIEKGVGANEMGVQDRLVFFDCYGTVRIAPRVDGKVTAAFVKQAVALIEAGNGHSGHSTAGTYKQFVLSCPETLDPVQAEKETVMLRDAAKQLVDWLGVRNALVFGHSDRQHRHCHVVVPNWSVKRGKSLHFTKQQLVPLLRLDWLAGYPGVKPGAFSKSQPNTIKALRREECIAELAERLGTEQVASKLEALVKSGEVKKYVCHGHVHLEYKNKKVGGVKALNYLLAKKGSAVRFNKDYKEVPADLEPVSSVSQTLRFLALAGLKRMKLKELDTLINFVDPGKDVTCPAERRAILDFVANGRRPMNRDHYWALLAITAKSVLRVSMGATQKIHKCEPDWVYPSADGTQKKFDRDILRLCEVLKRDMLAQQKNGKFKYLSTEQAQNVGKTLSGVEQLIDVSMRPD